MDELTDRTVALAEKAAETDGPVQFGKRTVLPTDIRSRLFDNRMAREVLALNPLAGIELLADGSEVWFHYDGDPVAQPGITKLVRVSIEGPAREVALNVPEGWRATEVEPGRFAIEPGVVADRNTIAVLAGGEAVSFVLLGPNQAKGFPAGNNVPKCPVCPGLPEACGCQKPA